MDFTEPMPPLRIFMGLRGRIPRKTFWAYGLTVLGLSAYLHALLAIAGLSGSSPGWEGLEGLLELVVLWALLAVSAKRWHDLGKSGWWALLLFVPAVGQLAVLAANGLMRGTRGPNRFGQDLTGQL